MRSPNNHWKLSVALLSAMAGVACAHAGPTARSPEPFRAFDCPANAGGEAHAFGHALTLAVDVDYLEVVSHGGGHTDVTVVERGAKCSGAADAAACTAELSRQRQAWLQSQPSCSDCRGTTLILTTHRDHVAQWSLPNELLTLLGPIDSPADAWLLLMARDGLPPYACGDASASAYRILRDRIELSRQEWTSSCRPIERVAIVQAVDRSGEIKNVSRSVVERDVDGCIKP
jgi:hypothetical protein